MPEEIITIPSYLETLKNSIEECFNGLTVIPGKPRVENLIAPCVIIRPALIRESTEFAGTLAVDFSAYSYLDGEAHQLAQQLATFYNRWWKTGRGLHISNHPDPIPTQVENYDPSTGCITYITQWTAILPMDYSFCPPEKKTLLKEVVVSLNDWEPEWIHVTRDL